MLSANISNETRKAVYRRDPARRERTIFKARRLLNGNQQ